MGPGGDIIILTGREYSHDHTYDGRVARWAQAGQPSGIGRMQVLMTLGAPLIALQDTHHPERTHSVTRPSVQVLYFNYNSATPKTTVAQNNNTKNRLPALNPMSMYLQRSQPLGSLGLRRGVSPFLQGWAPRPLPHPPLPPATHSTP